MKKHGFERIGILYALALGGIAAIIIVSQIFVQQHIRRQESDSRVINVAGRQRMLSQKISKLALQMGATTDTLTRQELTTELRASLALWEESHQDLFRGNREAGIHSGNSERTGAMFRALTPYFGNIVGGAEELLRQLERQPDVSGEQLQAAIRLILANEAGFLGGMDAIVSQYEQEARDRVLKLESIELLLLILTLSIILFELLFIFRPTARKIRQTVSSLVESEKLAKDMAREISILYGSLEKSYQELADIDVEVEQPVVYAKADLRGNLTYVADAFVEAVEYDVQTEDGNLFAWLEKEGYPAEHLQDIRQVAAEGQVWNGEVKVTSEAGDFVWLDMNIVPLLNESQQVDSLTVVCANKTERKEAEERSHEITREKIEKKLKEQQFRSVLVLEGQEEERRRISRDIHDGIGQLLTGLKLKIESIDLMPNAPARGKTVEEAKGLLNQLIREVRRVSFNLTPSALSDYGIAAVTKKFCAEVSRLSQRRVIFENRTGFLNRLDKSVETNLYRIVQEAVNNALKYAQAEEIRVVFSHNAHFLNVEIADNGVGFDLERYAAGEGIRGSGVGIHNMRERAGFIDGTFDIASSPGAGTKINVHVPLNGRQHGTH